MPPHIERFVRGLNAASAVNASSEALAGKLASVEAKQKKLQKMILICGAALLLLAIGVKVLLPVLIPAVFTLAMIGAFVAIWKNHQLGRQAINAFKVANGEIKAVLGTVEKKATA